MSTLYNSPGRYNPYRPNRPVRATRQSLRDGSYVSSRRTFNPLDKNEVRAYGQYNLNEMANSGRLSRNPNVRAGQLQQDPQARGILNMATTGNYPSFALSDEQMPENQKAFMNLPGSQYLRSNVRPLVNTLNPGAADYTERNKQRYNQFGFPQGLKPGVNYFTNRTTQGYGGTQNINRTLGNQPFGRL